jgi:bifunctional non-homologous end joining protein LigD
VPVCPSIMTRLDAKNSSGAKAKPPAASAPLAKNAQRASYHGVSISHAERVIDSESGLTKGDLARYYDSVASILVGQLANRPVSLVRAPQGIGATLFFQKHAEAMRIPGVIKLDAALMPEHPPLLGIETEAGVLGAAQMNTVEFHTWNAGIDAIDKPDRLVFDLDPGEGVEFATVIEGAQFTLALLDALGLKPFVKTSGGKGIHVVVPIVRRYSWHAAKDFSEVVVRQLVHTLPDRFVAKSGPKHRVGKIFVDYLRNAKGATTAAAFSARARPGLGVSMPIDRAELASLESGSQWTIADAASYLKQRKYDPWSDYGTSAMRLEAAAKKLDFELPKRSG